MNARSLLKNSGLFLVLAVLLALPVGVLALFRSSGYFVEGSSVLSTASNRNQLENAHKAEELNAQKERLNLPDYIIMTSYTE